MIQHVTCPYCGHNQRVLYDPHTRHQFVLCDIDSGGCDQYFAVIWKPQVTHTTYTLEPKGGTHVLPKMSEAHNSDDHQDSS